MLTFGLTAIAAAERVRQSGRMPIAANPLRAPQRQGLYDPANEHDSCGVGFVANIKGLKSHEIIRDGLRMLANLDHRGAKGADPLVGDGAGCLIQIPDALFRGWADSQAINLPPAGDYAVAMCFLPQDAESREEAERRLERFIEIEGQILLGWRDVPTNSEGLGQAVLASMPVIRQAIVARGPRVTDQDQFERKILAIRKQTQNPLCEIAEKKDLPGLADFYIPSFSTRTIVYKGLLLATQVGPAWRTRLRPALVAVGAIALILLPWQIYCAAYHLKTSDYNLSDAVSLGYLREHSDRLGPVLRELGKQLTVTHQWGYLVFAVAAGVFTGALARRWRATAFAVVWLALAFAGLVLIYWISTLPTSSNLTNSSFRTIVSLLVGGTALLPLLIAPTDPKDCTR